jgi:2-phosphosulfolactate phosphatase
MTPFDQSAFDIRCEWGVAAVDHSAPADVVVVVDVLSFSTSVDVALSRGASVLPYRWKDDSAAAYAQQHDAQLAGGRQAESAYSLAPSSLVDASPGLRLVLPSPNGSTIAFHALSSGARVVAGSLRNATAVAEWAARSAECVLVVPAGERWPDGSLRPAIEDLIGAGAIIARLAGGRSPEADVAVAAFESARGRMLEQLRACSSGREPVEIGFSRDVELAAALDVSPVVPLLDGVAFVRA